MQHPEVSGAVRHIYVVLQLRVKKDFWSCKRKRWYMENHNKLRTRLINKTQEYIKSYKSTKFKLIWPFTANAGRENGKKKSI